MSVARHQTKAQRGTLGKSPMKATPRQIAPKHKPEPTKTESTHTHAENDSEAEHHHKEKESKNHHFTNGAATRTVTIEEPQAPAVPREVTPAEATPAPPQQE